MEVGDELYLLPGDRMGISISLPRSGRRRGFFGAFFPSPDSISDVIIEPFPYPEGLEGLDITACIQGHRFAECEELLLEALPGAENNEEVTMYRYSMLGMVVEFQISMKQTQRKSPHRAFIGLFDQGESLAQNDEKKCRLHLASILNDKGCLYEGAGYPKKAISVWEELQGYRAVGTGSKKDELAAFSIVQIARLRLETRGMIPLPFTAI